MILISSKFDLLGMLLSRCLSQSSKSELG